MAFLSEDACTHVVKVVLLALLPRGVVTLLLVFLCLEVVAGVVLVADGERDDIEFPEALDGGSGSSHGEHLEDAILGVVAAVLGTAFALGYPEVFLLGGDGVVDVAAHELAALVHFLGLEAATDDEGFVHAHEGLDPGIYEEVVAYGYLAGGRKVGQVQLEVEDGAVEDYVAVVADEGVVASVADGGVVEGGAIGVLPEYVADDGLHEAYLEVLGGPDSDEGDSDDGVTDYAWEPWDKASHHDVEVPVVEQLAEGGVHLAFLVGTD